MNSNTVIRLVEVSSLFAKRALDSLSATKQSQKQAADRIPALVEHMVANGTIKAEEQKQAAEMLGNHAQTLTLLKTAIDKLAEARRVKQASLGEPAGDTEGPVYVDAAKSPFVGSRTSEKRASDHALMAGLGLTTG